MAQPILPPDWLRKFSDPYAILGVSIAADDRRILKRYREVAMLLHPDRQGEQSSSKELAEQFLAKLINPNYQKLKREQERQQEVAMLRMKVRSLTKEKPLVPKSTLAQRLIKQPVAEVDIFYEQAIAQLAEQQYSSFERFPDITAHLVELNLVYLQLKMGEAVVREKRTGLVASTDVKPIQFAPPPNKPGMVSETYDQRHFRRAQEYAKQSNWAMVVQELRDAIKLDATKSDYYALLGLAYLHQKLPGMGKTYIRQALKLNPQDGLALKLAKRIGLEPLTAVTPPSNGSQASPASTPPASGPKIRRSPGRWWRNLLNLLWGRDAIKR